MTIGEKIKQARIEKNMSQADLARAAKVTKATISNYERGLRAPQASVLYHVAQALDIPLSELAEYTMDGADVLAKSEIDDIRPQRNRKLLAAFDMLSDEGQRTLIEIARKLAYVPEYKMSVSDSLQRHIYKKELLSYMPHQDTEKLLTYKTEDLKSYTVNVRHIILHRIVGGNTYPWQFLYYQFEKPVDNGKLIRKIIDQNDKIARRCSADNSDSRYSLVFDDEAIYERFCECRRDQISEDGHREDRPLTFQPALSFLLIDKESLVVKGEFEDVKEVDLAIKYWMPLAESLQRYAYDKCTATYIPDECKEEIKTYEYEPNKNQDLESYAVNVRHIIMHRDTDGETSFWQFLYYQFKDEKPVDNEKLTREIINRNDKKAKHSDDNSNSRYTLIFDDEDIYDRFCECRRDQISEDGHPEDEPLTFQPALSFLLIDKESLVVKGEFEDVKGVEDEYGSDLWG